MATSKQAERQALLSPRRIGHTGPNRCFDAVGALLGMVLRADALRWQRNPELGTLADKVSDTSIPIGYPDDTVRPIADIMIATDTARIPITDPISGTLVGLVARKDLLRLRQSHNPLNWNGGPILEDLFGRFEQSCRR